MTTYVRTGGGRMIHRATCTRARHPVPWRWAEGKTVSQIRAELTTLGLHPRFCVICIPSELDALGDPITPDTEDPR